MLLQHITWMDVDAYLENNTAILVPIGSTEQHGPNGLIGTDAICPEIIAKGVAERKKILIAPAINFGMAQHHLGFSGTIALKPSTLLVLVKDIVASLARHGFKHLYFINGHGGNTNSVNAAFSEFYAEQSFLENKRATGVVTKIANWWTLPSVLKLAQELYGDAEGSHATPSEVALSYYAIGQEVRQVKLDPPVAPNSNIFDADDYRKRFPDGRIGSNPGLATAAQGKRFLTAAVDDVCVDFEKFLTLQW